MSDMSLGGYFLLILARVFITDLSFDVEEMIPIFRSTRMGSSK